MNEPETLSAKRGADSVQRPCYAAPTKPGFYWIRHDARLKGKWQPVAVDNLFGVLGFQKFGWTGWLAVEEAASMDMEWGGEVTCPHNDQPASAPASSLERLVSRRRPIQRDWWVTSTALCPPTLMLDCKKTGAYGIVEEFTPDEWGRAYHAPSNPYPWPESNRVALIREGKTANDPSSATARL